MPVNLESLFPNLEASGYTVTSPESKYYNCIAWAADETHRLWWTSPSPFAYWPKNVAREETLQSFILAFQTLGYEPCPDSHREVDHEKVAIYVDSGGKPNHMARQLNSGKWTRKLGELEDIEHEALKDIEGDQYGSAVQILKRAAPR